MSPTDPRQHSWITRGQASVTQMLLDEATGPTATADALAQLAATHAQQGRPQDAIPLYQRALREKYANTPWRLALAHSELLAHKPKEAARDARVVLQLRTASVEA